MFPVSPTVYWITKFCMFIVVLGIVLGCGSFSYNGSRNPENQNHNYKFKRASNKPVPENKIIGFPLNRAPEPGGKTIA